MSEKYTNSNFNPNPQSSDLYKRLGVKHNADGNEIKSSFRKCTFLFHPDHNPYLPDSEEKMRNVNEAYDVLRDQKKRRVYDIGGKDAVRNHENNRHSRFPSRSRTRKGPKIVRKLPCTLEDIYSGKVRRIRVTRNRVCKSCSGTGGKDSTIRTKCNPCDGTGHITYIRRLGPGFITKASSACNKCGGTGRVIPVGMECPACEGRSVVEESKILEVHIDRGVQHGQKIIFHGESHEEIGKSPGDIEFTISEQKHDIFTRVNCMDLEVTKTITLAESLTQSSFLLETLDGRVLKLKLNDQEFVKPDVEKMVRGEGMPKHRNPYQRGNLIVKFDIRFPDTIPQNLRIVLREMVPQRSESNNSDISEEVVLEEKVERGSFDDGNQFDDEDDEHCHHENMPNFQSCSVM